MSKRAPDRARPKRSSRPVCSSSALQSGDHHSLDTSKGCPNIAFARALVPTATHTLVRRGRSQATLSVLLLTGRPLPKRIYAPHPISSKRACTDLRVCMHRGREARSKRTRVCVSVCAVWISCRARTRRGPVLILEANCCCCCLLLARAASCRCPVSLTDGLLYNLNGHHHHCHCHRTSVAVLPRASPFLSRIDRSLFPSCNCKLLMRRSHRDRPSFHAHL